MEVLDLHDPALGRELSLDEEMEKLSALIEEVPARVRATAKSRVPARDPTGPLSVRRQVQAINPLPNRPSPSQADRLQEGTEGSLIGQVKR